MAPVAEKTIWTWWHSGKDGISPFLKACLESWQVHHPGWDVVLLDIQNIFEYLSPAELPPTFLDIGRRSLQSDLVRLAVLAKYGGCWTDLSCLALSGCVEAAWDLLHRGHCFVGYRSPVMSPDFVCTWLMVAKAKEPLVVEWSRLLNEVMQDRTTDRDVHKHPAFEKLDLIDYNNKGDLDAGFNSACWADYLVVNICFKAVLAKDDAINRRFWKTAVLGSEADPKLSPALWSQLAKPAEGLVFPESERFKMRRLLEEDPEMVEKLRSLPFMKFFNSGSPFSHLTSEQLMAGDCIIGRMVVQALTGPRPYPPETLLASSTTPMLAPPEEDNKQEPTNSAQPECCVAPRRPVSIEPLPVLAPDVRVVPRPLAAPRPTSASVEAANAAMAAVAAAAVAVAAAASEEQLPSPRSDTPSPVRSWFSRTFYRTAVAKA